MYVSMYVCMYESMYVCMYVCRWSDGLSRGPCPYTCPWPFCHGILFVHRIADMSWASNRIDELDFFERLNTPSVTFVTNYVCMYVCIPNWSVLRRVEQPTSRYACMDVFHATQMRVELRAMGHEPVTMGAAIDYVCMYVCNRVFN